MALNSLQATIKFELAAVDSGKKFSLDDCQYELLNIIENILILETTCDKRIHLKAVNFATDSKVFDNYSWFKLTEMK